MLTSVRFEGDFEEDIVDDNLYRVLVRRFVMKKVGWE